MRIFATVSKEITNNGSTVTQSGVRYLDLLNCEVFNEGGVVAIKDLDSGSKWTTTSPWSGAAAIFAAAPNSGGFFVLP